MASPPDIPSLHSAVTSALISTTRTVSELCAEDLAFHRSLDPKVGEGLDRQSARLLNLAERLIDSASAGATGKSDAGSERGIKLSSNVDGESGVADAIEENWNKIVDVVDGLLEKADATLDEFTGVVQPSVPSKKKWSPYDFFKTGNLTKPQLLFEHPPRNDETTPFKPLLTSKPHAIVPLEDSLRLQSSVDEDTQEQRQHYAHPYAPEINAYTYPTVVRTRSTPIPPTDFDANPATFVDTIEALQLMVEDLKKATEIAVDLEHHDYRSYIGMTSLMQISTREKDYVIDTLLPWRRQLEMLNEVFANPEILKVFHGSSMDMIWLQRDLGLYVVGLFDTYHGCCALGYQRRGLDYLLLKFANFEAQKQYQRADWRIRPLPSELFDYARSDTHFLLNIYDNMRNELIDRSTPNNDRLQYVLENSKLESLQRYEHPFYEEATGNGPYGWRKAIKAMIGSSIMRDKEQFAVFRALHAWRDKVAREEDDSTGFIIPHHNLLAVTRAMPSDKAALFAALPHISSTTRMRADELLAVIAKAKEEGKTGPEPKREDDEAFAPAKHQETEQTRATLSEAPKIFETPKVEDVRATTSNFWGSTFSAANTWNGVTTTAAAVTDRVRLALPLPNLSAQVFANPAEDPVEIPNMDGGADPATGSYGAAEDEPDATGDGSFINNPAYDANADELSIHPTEMQQEPVMLSRKEKNREKKKRNKSKKGSGGLPYDDDEVAEEAPFDYSTAPSMLHARDAQDRTGAKRGKKGSGAFDPYKKAMDAPKGLGRRQKSDQGGRSRTFAS
ncbi:hypothetical protein NA57DRAFT_65802 [Rhizodiscina lignyota]|uniref:HRDC domain-containing protein n=1 Tax=Rhizodiscina lignyota TaxID=1504668 RepID=A0A9P4M7G7_9PEZI|nr:hypothetical protein NA57DRAFT_65802 [Rhizodiscina lignyota]